MKKHVIFLYTTWPAQLKEDQCDHRSRNHVSLPLPALKDTFPPPPEFTPHFTFLLFFLPISHSFYPFNFDFPLSFLFLSFSVMFYSLFSSLFSYFLPQMTAAHISAPVLREEFIFLYVRVHPCETRKQIGDAVYPIFCLKNNPSLLLT
jgi:hypothetical protein